MDPYGRTQTAHGPEVFEAALRLGREMALKEVVAYMLEIAE
jgi:hypothetical protein